MLSIITLMHFVYNVFWKPILRSSLDFSDIFGAQLPSETAKKKTVEILLARIFFVILKLDLNALECHFLCVIHGPQNCMKWMKNAFKCWNLCFHMIVWCFNPFATIYLFLWAKIATFRFGVMACLWVQTAGFGVCLRQSLNNSPGHLSNTQRQRMTIENLILNGQVHTLFSENNTMSKLHYQRWKCLPPSI